MIAVDTSVAIAAFASWHEQHQTAASVVARGARLISHVAIETYAVLTRLPPPHRARPSIVIEFLERNFRRPMISLPPRELDRLLQSLAKAGVGGGASYDALVAASARHAGATLVTLDARAVPIYRAIGADVRTLP